MHFVSKLTKQTISVIEEEDLINESSDPRSDTETPYKEQISRDDDSKWNRKYI